MEWALGMALGTALAMVLGMVLGLGAELAPGLAMKLAVMTKTPFAETPSAGTAVAETWVRMAAGMSMAMVGREMSRNARVQAVGFRHQGLGFVVR